MEGVEGWTDIVETECDVLGGADFCATTTNSELNGRGCAYSSVMDAFKEFGLTDEGCKTVQSKPFGEVEICLCKGDLCNAK